MKFIIEKSNKKVAKLIQKGVDDFSESIIGKAGKLKNFNIYLKDDQYQITAGVTGYINRIKHVKVNYVWVNESSRGKALERNYLKNLKNILNLKTLKSYIYAL